LLRKKSKSVNILELLEPFQLADDSESIRVVVGLALREAGFTLSYKNQKVIILDYF